MKEQYKRGVLIWLVTGALLVATMVVVGGITRLTHSGLSMVEWKPLTGILPPLNESEWLKEFNNYKQYPEYKKLNSHFNLDDFKGIFWWEYIHRVLGRFLGIVFIVPFAFFLFKKVFDKNWKKKLFILFLLGGFQGLLGWFMVKSGLIENPSVSHYRLAAHLTSAFGLFSYILWLILDMLNLKKYEVKPQFKNWSVSLLVFVILQIVYGAFVAGMKAGLIYNTYPKMGSEWVSHIIPSSFSKLGFVSLINEPATVQFIHRQLPFVILAIILVLAWNSRNLNIKSSVYFVLSIWVGQFLLGIFTLLYAVPISLGVIHQIGALILLASLVHLFYRMKSSPAI